MKTSLKLLSALFSMLLLPFIVIGQATTFELGKIITNDATPLEIPMKFTIEDGPNFNTKTGEYDFIVKIIASYTSENSFKEFSSESLNQILYSANWGQEKANEILIKSLKSIITCEKLYGTGGTCTASSNGPPVVLAGANFDSLNNASSSFINENKKSLFEKIDTYLKNRPKGLKAALTEIEKPKEENAGYIKIKGEPFQLIKTEGVKNKNGGKQLKSIFEKKDTDPYRVKRLNWAVKDNKLFLRDVIIEKADNPLDSFKSLGTVTYPISLLNELKYQSIPITVDKVDYFICVDDIIDYQSPEKTINWGFYVNNDGIKEAKPSDPLSPIRRRQFPDIVNATMFYHLRQALGNGLNKETTNGGDGINNGQIELSFKVPIMDVNIRRGWQMFPDVSMALNISPLGKSSPYYLFDTTLPGKRYISSFEVLRNYYFFNQLNIPLLKYNKAQKMNLHSFAWDFGYKLYLTKMRNIFQASDSTYKVDYDNKDEIQTIGPYTSFRYEARANDIFGVDLELGFNFLNVRNGVNNSFLFFRQKNGIQETNFKPWLYTMNWGINVYFRPFFQTNNPSGIIFRYRQFYSFNNKTDIPYEIMIGYAINLRSVLRY